MKKITLLICIVCLLMLVNPVYAKPHDPISCGGLIDISESGSIFSTANVPFCINEGWGGISEREYPIGQYDFLLEVDNEVIEETYFNWTTAPGEIKPTIVSLWWVYYFPDGLTGVHIFEGHWFAACQLALDLGYTYECLNPNASVEVYTSNVTITFITP